MKRVAVVGGGIFGATAAIYAARSGHDVHLFEQQQHLLQAASAINQYRLHRGYHYPRSAETARSCREAERSFLGEYADAMISGTTHLYGIAKAGSKISYADFLSFCTANFLEYRPVEVAHLIDPAAADSVKVREASFDPDILRALVKNKLHDSGVNVQLGSRCCGQIENEFDRIIVAAYASTNTLLSAMGLPTEKYQFEVCEKPVVRLPASFAKTDIVIMDGPFLSIGPMGRSGTYVVGHAVHAIHSSNVGYEPEIPKGMESYLNKGIIRGPTRTNFRKFIEAGQQFIPELKSAEHVGSMYTIRAVLPDRDDTDERPTIVELARKNIISIFSGKIGNCVEAAKAATALI
ncbi:MAG: FAD-dependent oxidoreductase [Xanthobacteraceae bacterium]